MTASRPVPVVPRPVLATLAAWIGRQKGWRRCGLALLLGAMAALAMPPLHLLPLLILGLTGLVWLIDGSDAPTPFGAGLRRAFLDGWWFGLGHFCVGLYWIAHAFQVDAPTHGWMAPFAVLGLSLYFALFPALAAMVAQCLPAGVGRCLALAVGFALSEMLRGTLLTGFPWNLMASTLAFHAAPMQALAWIGPHGLGLVVVALAAMPASLASPATGLRRWGPCLGALAVACLLWAQGALRLALAPDPDAQAEGIALRVVQPNILQKEKWQPELALQHYRTLIGLSETGPGQSPPQLVIWPETALPYVVENDPRHLAPLAAAAPQGGFLITGMIRALPTDPDRSMPEAGRPLANAILVVTPEGGLAAAYDKHHLVPFGEYVPLRRFNPFPRLVAGRGDFIPGPGPAVLAPDGPPPFSPLVCYEAIFPGNVVPRGIRPDWLLNVTNDAWFGLSVGPHQHFAAARMRAVEQGLPLVRAANTGISAVIDPWGRVLAHLPLGHRGRLDSALPAPLPGPTAYASRPWAGFGLVLLGVLLAIAALAGMGASRSRPRWRSGSKALDAGGQD